MAKFRLKGGGGDDDEFGQQSGTGSANVAHEPTPEEERLGQLLVQRGILDPAHLAEALTIRRAGSLKYGNNHPMGLGDVIVTKEMAESTSVLDALSELYGVPVVNMRTVLLERGVAENMKEAEARRLVAMPMREVDGVIEIALSDPTTKPELDRIFAGKRTSFFLALGTQIEASYTRVFRADEDIDRFIKAFEIVEETRLTQARANESEDMSDDAPVVQVVNRIVAQALRDRSSDVHIEPLDDRMRIRYRIDGTLVDAFSLPIGIAPALISRLKIMAGMNIVERRKPQDGQFSMSVDGKEVDVRVATVATVFGEKCVLRLLDKSRSMLTLNKLGFPADTYEKYSELVHAPFGMVICAGPTGAGKTTTLYATLHEVNSVGKNIMTVEDPVEYTYPGINQIQTNEQAGLSFATGLKAILR
ncbi:MAG TPA: ATPase, T2SS/T4P/T4SS family, partial [Acidimicrobiales bacterium]